MDLTEQQLRLKAVEADFRLYIGDREGAAKIIEKLPAHQLPEFRNYFMHALDNTGRQLLERAAEKAGMPHDFASDPVAGTAAAGMQPAA